MCLNPAPRGHAIDSMARPVRIIRCVEGNRSESPEVQGGTRRPQATDSGACGLYPNGRVFSMSYMPHDDSRPFLPAPRRSGRDVSWSTRYESRFRAKARPASAADRFPDAVPDINRQAGSHDHEGAGGRHPPSDTRREGRHAAWPAGTNGECAVLAPACPHSRAGGGGTRAPRHRFSLTARNRPGAAVVPAPGTLRRCSSGHGLGCHPFRTCTWLLRLAIPCIVADTCSPRSSARERRSLEKCMIGEAPGTGRAQGYSGGSGPRACQAPGYPTGCRRR